MKTLKNLNHDEERILRFTDKEFGDWIKNNKIPISEDAIQEREKHFAILIQDGKLKEYHGKSEVKNIIKTEDIVEFKKVKQKRVIKGITVNNGCVTGRAKIIFTQDEADKIKEGDVLVASMTTPELLGAMRKASAFVTDEGGVLSHAAIIAREMNKPCVILVNPSMIIFVIANRLSACFRIAETIKFPMQPCC